MSRRDGAGRARTGFTLIEVMVGLGLIALLLGSIMSLVAELGRHRAFITAGWHSGRGVDALLDRMERDLSMVIAGDPQLGPGIQGTSDSLSLLTRSTWIDHAGTKEMSGAEHVDLKQVNYRPGSARAKSRDGPAGTDDQPSAPRMGGMSVEESPVWPTLRSAEAPDRSGNIADSDVVIRFRYLVGREWVDQVDSLKSRRLPRAVEVSAWIGSSPVSGLEDRAEPDRTRTIAIPDGEGGRTGAPE